MDLKSEDLQLTLEKNSELKILNDQIIKNKELLLGKLRDKEPIETPKIQDELLNNLSKEIENINKLQIELNSKQSQRIESLKKYNQQLIILEEKASLSSQYTQLSKFVEIKNRIFQEKQHISDVNIVKLTFLSKQAHTELLTENLLKSFKQHLEKLGLSNLSIQLQGSNSKGVQQTELILANNKNIEDKNIKNDKKMARYEKENSCGFW